MNERIRELANQVKWQCQDVTYGELEKFAELIVRECCEVLQNEDIRYSGYGYNQGFLHKKIKEHFGVE